MIRGRPAKPIATKRSEGNPGKRKLPPKAEKKADTGNTPRCPQWLDPAARLQFRHLVKILSRRRVLHEEDGMNLANMAQAWSDIAQARRTLASLPDKQRQLVKSGNGVQVNPLYYLIKHNVDLLYKLGARYGFDPASRSTLHFEEDNLPAIPETIKTLLAGAVEVYDDDPVIQ